MSTKPHSATASSTGEKPGLVYVSEQELRPRRNRGKSRPRAGARPSDPASRRGVALVMVIAAITVLAVFVADLMESAVTEFHVAESERDRLKAEYLAKSGANLTRLLIAREPDIRRLAAPIYQMLIGRPPPQLNVWDFASTLLAPFANLKDAKTMTQQSGVDFSLMKGVKDTGGTFEVLTVPENGKINLNAPLFFTGDEARRSIAMQLFALLGGYQSPESPYDPMFSARDPDGHYTTRLDIVSDMIDWWDPDDQRTVFDPGSASITVGGSEDNIYAQYPEPYLVKNAPFDSLEELRLIRGVSDDFWATFVEPKADDPRARKVTIYGSGAVNVNMAPPEVLLARLCSFVTNQPLCRDPGQAASFIMLFNTARMIIPIALFSGPEDFVNFVTASPSRGMDMYAILQSFLKDSPLMAWTPMVIPPELKPQIMNMFLTEASIFTIQSTGRVGRAQAKLTMIVNFDKAWVPPPGVAGVLPPLGVTHYYRIE
ncbi:MAG: general secretion pathway protein GspK [Polyangiales bacterium]